MPRWKGTVWRSALQPADFSPTPILSSPSSSFYFAYHYKVQSLGLFSPENNLQTPVRGQGSGWKEQQLVFVWQGCGAGITLICQTLVSKAPLLTTLLNSCLPWNLTRGFLLRRIHSLLIDNTSEKKKKTLYMYISFLTLLTSCSHCLCEILQFFIPLNFRMFLDIKERNSYFKLSRQIKLGF